MAISDEVKAKLSGGAARIKASAEDIRAALTKQPHPNPLADAPEFTDAEQAIKDELNRMGAGLSGISKAWAEKFATMNDTEYWLALCFKDRASKERFLEVFELHQLGDKYLNGHHMAQILGKSIDEEPEG